MILGIPLMLSLMAGGSDISDREELAAYEECRSARRTTTVWRIDVEDAWLRAGEAPEAPAKGVLHRGETVKLLKQAASGNLLVKTGEGRKGYLRSDEVVEMIVPPLDPRPLEDCPQPGFFRDLISPRYLPDPPEAGPVPGRPDTESPAAEEASP